MNAPAHMPPAHTPPAAGGRHPGRPCAYDRAAALETALAMFWRQGYSATSLDDLTGAMGLSRSSFYGCFGSKHGALLAAIAHYNAVSLVALEKKAAGEPRQALRRILAAIADPEGGRRGCFFVNCATELAPHDPEAAALIRAHLDRVSALIERIGRGADPAFGPDGARALLALALGAVTLRKTGATPADIHAILSHMEPLLPG